MYKDSRDICDQEKTNTINKKKLRITKQNLNDINDYILNFQRYFELIKNYPILRQNKKLKELDTLNIEENLFKRHPYNKLQNDINNIYKRVYTENSIDNNNSKSHNKYLFTNNEINKKMNYSVKKSKRNKSIDKYNNKNINEDLNSNTINIIKNIQNNHNYYNDYNSKRNYSEKNKFEFGNYAMNNTNFNHPQLYLLKYNKSYDIKEKLPQINSQGGLKITRAGDLSLLIPQNSRKEKVKNNFYNYYIGLKRSKHKFNI